MKLSNNFTIRSSQIPYEIEQFLAVTKKNHWEYVIRNIENTSGHYYKNYLYIRNPLAKALQIYFELAKKGLSIYQYQNKEIYFLGKITHLFNHLYNNFNKHAKNILIGRIKDDDVRSILFEFKIATHFFTRGFDIDFVEYDKRANYNRIFDLLLIKDGKELEVECKYKNYDSKRKITRPALYLLVDLIISEIDISKFNCLIAFEFKSMLSKNRDIQSIIIDNLKLKLNSKDWSKSEYDKFTLEIFPLAFSGVLDTTEKVINAIKPYYTENCHFVSLSSNKNNLLLRFSTLEKENIAEGIYESLKDSLQQFSKSRAGIIACHIEGIYPEEWEKLRNGSSLSEITKLIFSKAENNFIHSIIYSSKSDELFIDNIFKSNTPNLSFKNLNSKFHNTEP